MQENSWQTRVGRWFYPVSWLELLGMAGLGAFVGAVPAMLGSWLGQSLDPIMCNELANWGFCGEGDSLGFHVVLVVASIIALLVLIIAQSYLPLIMAIAPVIAFWGVDQTLAPLKTIEPLAYLGAAAGVFAVMYILLYLLSRIKKVSVSLLLVLALVVLLQLQMW